MDETLNSDNTHDYTRCGSTGISLIKASIKNKAIHELPNLNNIALHDIINTIKDKLSRKSMPKYVQALKEIINTTKGNQSLQAYFNQRTPPERNNNGEQQHL
eukprot:Pgem_evm1s8441